MARAVPFPGVIEWCDKRVSNMLVGIDEARCDDRVLAVNHGYVFHALVAFPLMSDCDNLAIENLHSSIIIGPWGERTVPFRNSSSDDPKCVTTHSAQASLANGNIRSQQHFESIVALAGEEER